MALFSCREKEEVLIMSKRSNGEGTIYKRKDGRWCGAYYDEQYNRRYVYGKTQSAVKKELKEKQESGTIKHKPYTLESWVLEFLEKYKSNELKITTYNSYMLLYRKHILNSKLGNMKLDNVKASHLQQFYNDKIKEGYSSKTVRSMEVVINSALDKAFKLRIIKENPNLFTTIPKKKKYEAKVLTLEEVERILNEAKKEKIYPIVVTTLYTGLRKGEVMALKWDNVDFLERKIYVKNSLCRVVEEIPDEKGCRRATYQILEPKTKKSVRTIPMLDEVYEALLEQKRRQGIDKEKNKDIYDDQGFVFADEVGNYLAQRQFMTHYHDFLEKYAITNIRFHDLRHTFATLLIESDISIKIVQELLGHSNISTSMDIYTHVSDKKKEQAITQLRIRKIDDADMVDGKGNHREEL